MDSTIFLNILYSVISFFVVSLTIGFIVFIVYVIFILKKIHDFLSVVKLEAEKISNDIANMKDKIKSSGEKFISFAMGVASFLHSTKKKKSKRDE